MRNMSWIRFIAFRYVSASKKRRQSSATVSSVFAIFGIAIGVFALIIVIGIMNGFQMGFIESILEISSFHIRIEIPKEAPSVPVPSDNLFPGSDNFIRSAIPFTDFQALVRGNKRNQQVALVRGLPDDARQRDPSLIDALHVESGTLDLTNPHAILLGVELARSLGLHIGDTISVVSIAGDLFSETRPELDTFIITGFFRSDFYEFDSGWAFINLDRALALQDDTGVLQIGIKLKDRWKDQVVLRSLAEAVPDLSDRMTSWREYNRSFFGALRTEKLIMFFLVGLIFVVVSLNIYQSQRKTVLERREEIGLLKALGASVSAIKSIFITDGFLVGFTGATLGLLPSLWISGHLQSFFTLLEWIVNSIILIGNKIAGLFLAPPLQGETSFSFFSPQVFYLKDIPCRLVPYEVTIIYVFGILSATIAAALAAGSLGKLYPAEVLRYEQQ